MNLLPLEIGRARWRKRQDYFFLEAGFLAAGLAAAFLAAGFLVAASFFGAAFFVADLAAGFLAVAIIDTPFRSAVAGRKIFRGSNH